MHSVVPSEDASQYVFKNDSFPPLSQFKVKVGVYNSIGEGPYTPVSLVYSGDEGWVNIYVNSLDIKIIYTDLNIKHLWLYHPGKKNIAFRS